MTDQPTNPGLPEMPYSEASFHTNAAGIRASEAHSKSGGDRDHIAALATAAAAESHPLVIAGYEIADVSVGHLLTLELIGSQYVAEPRADGQARAITLDELMLAAVVFIHPERAYQLASQGDIAQLRTLARELRHLSPEDWRRLNAFINEGVSRFQDTAEAADDAGLGKPAATATPTPSSAAPRQAQGGSSPSSSGSSAPTGSPSTAPSSTPRSASSTPSSPPTNLGRAGETDPTPPTASSPAPASARGDSCSPTTASQTPHQSS